VTRCYKEDSWNKTVVTESVKRRLKSVQLKASGKEVTEGAEEFLPLEAVTRERLVKTQQTEKT
jgi:hypothetical protein